MQIKNPPLIFQVVGYKNSGKTTLMERLISYLSSKELQVGTLKHHGHGGEPASVKETDSSKHLQAGSSISAVQGERELHITVKDTTSFELDELLQFYTVLPLDILLIEGYKKADYPKIVILKDEKDMALLELSNIIAVGCWNEVLAENSDYYTFPLQKTEENLPALIACMVGRQLNEN
ncbi:molybdopterin-guanine dinucleotide biosynthesis protein B [Virgibacillus sp. C22-A2]|uniref:Molybdopterin-guanine dinucleotide biosynthesis protein B n=1 Tax=Virgibacillus tibetensis TaxID=3042313 RepID=A0ABU6KEA4_9BACI|nr:molybdopterin-guanine dinucleotide biosynthesis protein B [Virgibacillus sp. C22-A2]